MRRPSATPFNAAGRLSTLVHPTEGRRGWNVVTGDLDSAARAVGIDGLAQRYGPDDAIANGTSNAIQSTTQAASQRGLTRRKLLARLALRGRCPLLVGDGDTVAAGLERGLAAPPPRRAGRQAPARPRRSGAARH